MALYRYLVRYSLKLEQGVFFLRFPERRMAMAKAEDLAQDPRVKDVCVIDTATLKEVHVKAGEDEG